MTRSRDEWLHCNMLTKDWTGLLNQPKCWNTKELNTATHVQDERECTT